MTKKTYGVFNLVEYEASLNIGGKVVKALFKNGSITQQGIDPARYTTTNPVVQFAIEHHPSFKSGRIKLVSCEELAESQEPKMAVLEPYAEATQHEEEKVAPTEEGKAAPTEEEKAAPLEEIEVTCLDDAKAILRDRYGVRSAHTKAAVKEAAMTYGILFKRL